MTQRTHAIGVIGVLTALVASCVQTPRHIALRPEERVIGRIRQTGRVRLLTTQRRLVTITLETGEVVLRELHGLARTDEPWGLASAGDRGMFTLLGAEALGELDLTGRLVRRLSLSAKYVGLFGVGSELLVQPASTRPGDQILRRLDTSDSTTSRVGALRAVQFDTRAEHLTLNLVNCGSTQGGELPCWLNQDVRVDRTRLDGGSRLVDLVGAGLRPRPTRSLERMKTPGPVLDAHIDASGRLWVLIHRPDTGNQWPFVLARYLEDARLDAIRVIQGRPRLILDVASDECILLTGAGSLRSVRLL